MTERLPPVSFHMVAGAALDLRTLLSEFALFLCPLCVCERSGISGDSDSEAWIS